MPGSTVAFRATGVRYAGVERAAVDGVDLEIAAGTLAVLLGPSGCGKSTLLRTVNRLVEPTSGAVLVDGVDVRTRDAVALRRDVGYVIQAVGLFPHYTVAQNVAIVPRLLGWDDARIAARIDDLLARVRLDPARYRDRKPRELSGGEAQRVGVARALAAEPRLLLMDEPFAAVDAIVRASLQDEVRRLHAELGTTILFVTHDVDEALRLADEIVVMNAGRVVQHAAPATLLEHPADDFVRGLVGIDAQTRRLAAERPLIERA